MDTAVYEKFSDLNRGLLRQLHFSQIQLFCKAARRTSHSFRSAFINGEYDISMVKYIEALHMQICALAIEKADAYLNRELH